MGVGINIPQKKPDQSKQLLKMAGTAVGAAYGGAPGAAIGGSLSGMALGPDKQGPRPIGQSDSAMSRRMSALSEDPGMVLNNSIDSLKFLDPEDRDQYAGPLIQAQMQAEKQRGGIRYGG